MITLRELEHYGWELRFMRREPFRKPVAVLFAADRTHYAVLEEDGSLDEHPGFEIRH